MGSKPGFRIEGGATATDFKIETLCAFVSGQSNDLTLCHLFPDLLGQTGRLGIERIVTHPMIDDQQPAIPLEPVGENNPPRPDRAYFLTCPASDFDPLTVMQSPQILVSPGPESDF